MATDESSNEVNTVSPNPEVNGIYGDAVSPTPVPVISAVSPTPVPVISAVSPTPHLNHAPHPNDLRITRAQVDQVVNCIKNIVDGRKPNAGMIIRIVANCMALTNKLKTNTATSKKLVINAIQEFIQSSDAGLSPEETEALMGLVDITVDDAFDTLKEVAKKDIPVVKSCCVVM
jgi:hypothetical protein